MINWPEANVVERRLLQAISIIFSKSPNLLEFLFDPGCPRLRALPEDLLKESYDFSAREDLLVRVALDMWSGSGNAQVWELLEYLDSASLIFVAQALKLLRTKFNGWDGPVMRQ
jgi:hypothetical protein